MNKNNFKNLRIIQLTIFLAIGASLFYLILKIDNLLLSALLAFLIHYLLKPFVEVFERSGLNRTASTLLVFSLSFLSLSVSFYLASPFLVEQIQTLKLELPQYITGISHFASKVEAFISTLTGSLILTNFSSQTETFMNSWATSLFKDLPAYISHSLTTLFLAPFLAFFSIKDGPVLSKEAFAFVPNSIFELCLDLHHQINEQIGQFIRARLLEAAFVGFIVWAGLYAIDFPFAVLLAFFAAIANLIPYIGPIIGAAPAIALALMGNYETSYIFLVTGVYGVAQILDILFIIPLVVAKIVNLHPVTVVISIIIGAQVMGILGMIISIPAASALKIILSSVYSNMLQFRV